jgi:hypothetical protein
VLHLPHFLLRRLGVSPTSRCQLGIRLPLPFFLMLMTFGMARAPHGRAKWHEKWSAGVDVRALASPVFVAESPSLTHFQGHLPSIRH